MPSLSRVKPESLSNSGAEYYSNNLLINPSFEIWQRGTSVSNWGSFGYTADNVQIGYDGTPPSGRTVSRQTFAMGQTDIPEGDPRYYLQYDFPSCGTPTNYLRFPVEGVRTLAGKTATFSFWAKVPTGTMTIGVAICQEFGSGGSPSAGVYPAATNYTVTSTWQKFVFTTTLTSISGKTVGTNNNDMIWPAIWCPTNAAGTIQLANLKLEQGGTATPFQKRPVSVDDALCKRYLVTSYPQGVSPGTANTLGGPSRYADAAGYYCSNWAAFPVQMRALPSITIYSPINGAAGFIGGDAATKNGRIDNISTVGFQAGAANTLTSSGEFVRFHYLASAEL